MLLIALREYVNEHLVRYNSIHIFLLIAFCEYVNEHLVRYNSIQTFLLIALCELVNGLVTTLDQSSSEQLSLALALITAILLMRSSLVTFDPKYHTINSWGLCH